jgi:fumarate reductase subunit C
MTRTPVRIAPPGYRRPMSRWWWLRKRSYTLFALREVSAVFVAWSVVFLVVFVDALAAGQATYQAFLDWAATPWVVALNVVTLAFLLLHAVTWINLTPAAVVVKVGGRRVPPRVIAGSAFAGWAAVSALVLWLVVRL